MIKMFFAMGIPWVAEVLSFSLDRHFGRENVQWYIFPFDVVNALQGLIIFCVVFFDSTKLDTLKTLLRRDSSDNESSHMPGKMYNMHSNENKHQPSNYNVQIPSGGTLTTQEQQDSTIEQKV